MMKFKLLSYKQALRKARERNDKEAVKSWKKDIIELQNQIKEM